MSRAKDRDKEQEEKDPLEQLLEDRGYTLVETYKDYLAIARDPFNQIHYICALRRRGGVCGAEFFNILDLVRHHVVYHGIAPLYVWRGYLEKLVKEGKVVLTEDQIRSTLPQKEAEKLIELMRSS